MARKEKSETKLCRYCKMEIPRGAKICPHCRKKQKKGKLKWILLAVIALFIYAAVSEDTEEKSGTKKIGEVSQPNSVSEEDSTAAVYETENASDADREEAEEDTVYHVGDILLDGSLKIVYMSSGEYTEDNEYMQAAEGNKFIYIQLAFINTSEKSDASVSMYSFEGYADGYSVDMYYGGEDTLSSTLSAGRSVSGYLYFEVPEDAQDIEIEYETNIITGSKINFVYEGDLDSGYVLETNTEASEGALHVGDMYESNKFNITYLQCFTDQSDNMFITPKDGYHYVTCEFEFENVSSSDRSVSFYSFDCYADGVACDQSYYRDDAISAELSSGRKTKGTVTFEVPDDAQTVEVEFLDNYWTSSRIVFSVEES